MRVLGDIEIAGEKERPVLLSTQTKGWGGIELLGSPGEGHKSKIEFAIIEKVLDPETYSPVRVDQYDQLIISNTTIRYNSGSHSGGLYVINSSTKIDKCLIYKNRGEVGAIVMAAGLTDRPVVENCTVAYNIGTGYYKAIVSAGYNDQFNVEYRNVVSSFPYVPKIRNCIIWGEQDVVQGSASEMVFENCIIKGASLSKPEVAINKDPLFVNPEEDDYRLVWENYPNNSGLKSPAIDASHFNTPNDPDGSPADLGALPFNQSQGVFKPKADFLSKTTRGQTPFLVPFTNNSSAGTNKELIYHWDFGDGFTSAEKSPQHEYKENGTYSVSLTVKDGSGLEATLRLPNYIKSGTAVTNKKVEGTWTKTESPYLVYNDITVDSAKSLQIRPGVEIEFQGEYDLTVYGNLQALGTAEEKILFHAKDTAHWIKYEYSNPITYEEGWGGINFLDTLPKDTVRLLNCIIKNVGEFGRRGTYFSSGKPKYIYFPPLGSIVAYRAANVEIDSCSFISNFVSSPDPSYNDGSVYFYGSPGVSVGESNAKVTNCLFTDNGIGSYSLHRGQALNVYQSKIEIARNIISNNKKGWRASIHLTSSDASVHHNTIEGNSGIGIYMTDSYKATKAVPRYTIHHNRIAKNTQGINLFTSAAFTHVYNNWILENKGALKGAGIYSEASNVYAVSNVIAYNENNQVFSNGGGGYYGEGKVIANNTIYRNKATNMGGHGLYTGTSGLIANNIIFGNEGWGSNGQGDYVFYQFDPYHDHPDAVLKNNLIGVDPSFRLKTPLDFSLKPGSVAIDKGMIDTTGLFLPILDLMGSPRVDAIKGIVDIGAFEHTTTVTNVEADLKADLVRLKPNPASDAMTLSLTRPSNVTVYSIEGKPIKQLKLNVGENRIDLQQLSPGVYILYFEGLNIRRKIVKL